MSSKLRRSAAEQGQPEPTNMNTTLIDPEDQLWARMFKIWMLKWTLMMTI